MTTALPSCADIPQQQKWQPQHASTRERIQRFEELPIEVLFEVFRYFHDPLDLCRLAASCRTFRNLVLPRRRQQQQQQQIQIKLRNDDDNDDNDTEQDVDPTVQTKRALLWQRLYEERWGTDEQPKEEEDSTTGANTETNKITCRNDGSYVFQKYRMRQQCENKAVRLIRSLCYNVTRLNMNDMLDMDDGSDDDELADSVGACCSSYEARIRWDRVFVTDGRLATREHVSQMDWNSLKGITEYRRNVRVLLWHWCHGHWDYPTLCRNFPRLGTTRQLQMTTTTTTTTSTTATGMTLPRGEKVPYRVRLLQCFAAHVLDWMHYAIALEKWEGIVTGGQPHCLEEGVLLLMESLFSREEILRENPVDRRQSIREKTKHQIDNMAQEFKTRLQRQSIPYASLDVSLQDLKQCFNVLNQFLLDEFGLRGNVDDYYNVNNSLLHHVLATKKGIPITLCVLYKLICSRIGIQVDLIGLPRHVVLGVNFPVVAQTGGNAAEAWRTASAALPAFFVDVFHHGQFLSLSDCHRMVQGFGFSLHALSVLPLSTLEIWTRMGNNLEHAVGQALQQQAIHDPRIIGVRMQYSKVRNLFSMLAIPPHNAWHYLLFATLELDPDVFCQYRVLSRDNWTLLEGSFQRVLEQVEEQQQQQR